MKNRLLTWLLAMLMPILPLSAQLTVNVATPGTLWETIEDMGISPDTIHSLKVTGVLNESDYQFMRKIATALSDIDLSELTISRVPEYAFKNDTTLRSLRLPESITTIGHNAFEECRNLTRLAFGTQIAVDSVFVFPAIANFEDNCFSQCKGIREVDLSQCTNGNNSVNFGNRVFGFCEHLKSVIMPTAPYVLYWGCFEGTAITEFTVTEYCQYFGGNMFSNLQYLYIQALTPPNADITAFSSTQFDNLIAYVPTGTRRLYMLADGWSELRSIQEYGLQVKIGDNGSIIFNNKVLENNEVIFHEKQAVSLTVRPNPGYELASATLDNQPATVTGNQIAVPAGLTSAKIQVSFAKKQLSVSATIVGDGSVMLNDTIIQSGHTANYGGGATLSFKLTPNPGNAVQSITCNGVEQPIVNGGLSFTIDALDENSNLLFTFASESSLGNTHALAYTQVGQGEVTYAGSVLRSGSNIRVNDGTALPLSIVPMGDFSLEQVLYNNTDLTSSVANNTLTLPAITADGNLQIRFTSPTDLTLSLTGGDLYSQLQAMGANLNAITHLRLSGTINSQDFAVMKSVLSALTFVDLSGCTGLTTIPATAFAQKQMLREVHLPLTTTRIQERAFEGCYSLTTVTGCDNIQELGYVCFSGCNSLRVLPFGDKLKKFEYGVFMDCNALPENIIFPASLEENNGSAFQSCRSIKSVDFSQCNQLRSLAYNMFYDCINLTTVILPTSRALSIESQAFYNTNLQHITLPANVFGLGDNVFPVSLESLNVESSDPATFTNISSNAFSRVDLVSCVLNVPAGSSLAYRLANNWAAFMNIQESGLAFMFDEAFGALYVDGKEQHNGSTLFHNATAVELTIVPAIGYEVSSVSIGNTSLTVTDNKVTVPAGITSGIVSITFSQKQLKARTTIIGNGSVSCEERTLAATDSISVAGGQTLQFTLTPNDGYAVKEIRLNGEPVVLTNNGLRYTTPAMDADAQIAFEFVPLSDLANTSILTVYITGDGQVQYQGATLTDGGQVRITNGENAALSFVSNGDFSLDSVLVDGAQVTTTNGIYQITNMQADMTVDVTFSSPTNLILHLNGGDLYTILQERQIIGANVRSLTVSGKLTLTDFTAIKAVLTNLQYLDISQTDVTVIPSEVFRDKHSIREVHLPLTITQIQEHSFDHCSNLTTITGCDNIQELNQHCFADCYSLKVLPFGDKLKTIGFRVFPNCQALPENIIFPASLEETNGYVFSNCMSIKSVDFSQCSQLVNISYGMFNECQNLTTVVLPTSRALRIENNAFYNTNLQHITLPSNVVGIDENAFPLALEVINVESANPATFTDVNNNAFGKVDLASCVLNVPAGASLAYRSTAPWAGFQNIVEAGIKVNYNDHGEVYAANQRIEMGAVVFHNKENIAFRVVPAPGYEVGSVRFAKQEIQPAADGTYMVGAGVESDTLAINFVLRKFDVSVQTTGAGHVELAGTVLPADATIQVDSSMFAVLTLVPDAGYMVKRVSFNEADAVVQNAGTTYATPALNAPASIEVEFAQASELSNMALISFSIGEHGVAEYMHSTLLSETSFYITKGDTAEFTFVPDNGFMVDTLLVNGAMWNDSIQNNMLTLYQVDTTAIRVSFKLNPYASIHLDEPGSLARKLADEQKSILTHLTITGEINESDFRTIRDELPLLESLDIYGTNCTYIPYQAFCINSNWDQEIGKTTLKEVRLPQHVQSIGYCAFAGCTNLESVNFDELADLEYIEGRAFRRTGLISIDLSNTQLRELTNYEFNNCSKLANVIFPQIIQRLSEYTFSESAIERVNFLNCTSLTEIGNGVFDKCKKLSEVLLPDGLQILGTYAFAECELLTSISIPASVTYIRNDVFRGTRLTSIDLSHTQITVVPSYAFSNNKKLTSVLLPPTITTIQNYAFHDCNELEIINLDSLFNLQAIGEYTFCNTNIKAADLSRSQLTSIPRHAFYMCRQLESIKLPNTVSSIGENAFDNTALTSIELPTSLLSIGRYAFNGAPIHGRLTLPASLQSIGEWAFSSSDFTIVQSNAAVPPTLQSIFNQHVAVAFVPEESAQAYKNAPYWEDLNILSGEIHAEVTVTSPGNLAVDIMDQDSVAPGLVTHLKVHGAINATDFAVMRSNMTVLYDLDLSDADVSIIPENAFLDKTVLMHVKLPDDLLMIEENAFSGCTSLMDTLVLPTNLRTIGVGAFQNCKSLSYLAINPNLEVIRNRAFYGCSGLTQELTFPEQFTSLGEYAFADCYGLNGTLTFNQEFYMFIGAEGYHSETGYAFLNCTNIRNIDMSACEYLYEIPSGTFQGCSNVSEVLLPPYVERIDEYVFQNCGSLVDISFPTSLILINHYTFANCSSLRVVNLSDCEELGTINHYAFFGCHSLHTISLPKSVNYIGDRAFEECRNLQNISVEARTPADLGEYVFRKVNTSECVLSIPTLSFNDYLTAAQWGAFVQMRKAISITLDEGAGLSYSKSSNTAGPNRARAEAGVQPNAANEDENVNIKDGTSLYVQDQDVVTFYINPEENVAIRQVLFNNTDVTNQLSNNSFQTPNVTGSSTFSVLLDVTGPINAREIVLDRQNMAIKVAESESVVATIYPNNTTDKTIIWTVENDSIASVSSAGVVTGIAPGVTTLTATTQDGGHIAQCEITIMSNDYYFLMDTTRAYVEDVANVAVRMINSGDASGFQCDVYLPEGLSMIDNGDCGVILTDRSNNHIVHGARRTDGSVRLIAYSNDGNNFIGKEDILFKIPVNTLDTVGVFEIQLKNIHISGPQNFDFVAPDITTQIRVSDYPLGDSNGDGDVTVSDVSTTVSQLLEQYVPRFIRKAADANKDKTITVADVTATVDIIVERPVQDASYAPRRVAAVGATDDKFVIADFEMQPSEVKMIAVELDNTQSYTAFQCDIFLPEGLHVVMNEDNTPMVSLSSRKTASHMLTSSAVANGAIRLVAVSMQNQSFSNAEKALFYITVEADAAVSGSEQIVISNIRLVEKPSLAEYLAPEATACVTYKAPSSLDNVDATELMTIYAHGHTLFIESAVAAEVMLVSADGKMDMLKVIPGTNTFMIQQAGVYLVGRKKVIIW